MNANADLSFCILRYSAQKLADGDLNTLFELGFTIDDIKVLETLDLKQLNHLSRFGIHFLDIKINHSRFDRSLQHIRREAECEAQQDDLLRLLAPAPMMRALFGMTSLQYANRRKLLGLSGIGVGRPALPSEDAEQRVWSAWRQHESLADGERYLATAESTQLNLNVIWIVVQAWDDSTGEGDQDDCRTNVSLSKTHPSYTASMAVAHTRSQRP